MIFSQARESLNLMGKELALIMQSMVQNHYLFYKIYKVPLKPGIVDDIYVPMFKRIVKGCVEKF